jgi:hypothetical protein
LKCAEKEVAGGPPFDPESPFVIVCEGWQDASLVCGLLASLGITNCDVTYPTKTDGGNGKDAINKVVSLLVGRASDLNGIAVIADADPKPEDSFRTVCSSFAKPFEPPPKCFDIHQGRKHRTAVYLIPGRGKTGALEHLFLDAITGANPNALHCIDAYRDCTQSTADWSENKIGKMRLAAYVAAYCKNDPCCSPAFLWSSKNRILDLANPMFDELKGFLTEFTTT